MVMQQSEVQQQISRVVEQKNYIIGIVHHIVIVKIMIGYLRHKIVLQIIENGYFPLIL